MITNKLIKRNEPDSTPNHRPSGGGGRPGSNPQGPGTTITDEGVPTSYFNLPDVPGAGVRTGADRRRGRAAGAAASDGSAVVAYTGTLVIAGHNYRSHFSPIKTMTIGDQLTFTDMDGNVFCYQVSFTEVLRPTAVEEMESGDWDLTLFTCTYGGQTRFALRCTLVETKPAGKLDS